MTQHRSSSAVRQEPNDISTRAVIVAGLVVIAVSAVGVVAMDLMLRARHAQHGPIPPVSPGIGASLLEYTNILDTARGQLLQERARRQLDEWGWVEKGNIARIPIADASRWLLEDARKGGLNWRDQEADKNPTAPVTVTLSPTQTGPSASFSHAGTAPQPAASTPTEVVR